MPPWFGLVSFCEIPYISADDQLPAYRYRRGAGLRRLLRRHWSGGEGADRPADLPPELPLRAVSVSHAVARPGAGAARRPAHRPGGELGRRRRTGGHWLSHGPGSSQKK